MGLFLKAGVASACRIRWQARGSSTQERAEMRNRVKVGSSIPTYTSIHLNAS